MLLRKPRKLFASVARVCQRQLGFLVIILSHLHFEVIYGRCSSGSSALFDELKTRVGPLLKKKETFMRKLLKPSLAIAFCYLASGIYYQCYPNSCVVHNTVSDSLRHPTTTYDKRRYVLLCSGA